LLRCLRSASFSRMFVPSIYSNELTEFRLSCHSSVVKVRDRPLATKNRCLSCLSGSASVQLPCAPVRPRDDPWAFSCLGSGPPGPLILLLFGQGGYCTASRPCVKGFDVFAFFRVPARLFFRSAEPDCTCPVGACQGL